MSRICVIAMILGIFFNCNNYGLVDKLENPENWNNRDDNEVGELYAFVADTQVVGASFSQFTNTPYNCAGVGIAAADCACNYFAQTASLPGSYVAWLSSSSEDMTCRIFGQHASNCALGLQLFRRGGR
ncbi:MAG: hypothetical protein LDLANPLL_02822 [Turneriella sp.]|nr:hypothetical protein [Turneriella sp.]